MEDRNTVAFKLIQDFVELSAIVLKSHRSVALWNRLVNKADDNVNMNTQERCLKAFTNFCRRYKQTINSKEMDFDRDAVVRFSDRIFINVRALLHKSTDEDKEEIRDILLRLNAILTRDDQSLTLLDKMDDGDDKEMSFAEKLKGLNLDFDTNEGQFIGNILHKVSNVIEDGDISENPQHGLMKLMTSGLLQDITEGAKGKIESGELSISNMLGAFQQVASQFEGKMKEEKIMQHFNEDEVSGGEVSAQPQIDREEIMNQSKRIVEALHLTEGEGEVKVEEIVETVVKEKLKTLPTIEECDEEESDIEVEV